MKIIIIFIIIGRICGDGGITSTHISLLMLKEIQTHTHTTRGGKDNNNNNN